MVCTALMAEMEGGGCTETIASGSFLFLSLFLYDGGAGESYDSGGANPRCSIGGGALRIEKRGCCSRGFSAPKGSDEVVVVVVAEMVGCTAADDKCREMER